MNIQELLRQPISPPNWQGTWARIWLRPDVFSVQEYLVGAAALDGQGLAEFRVLTGAQKFECIYGAGSKTMFERMLNELSRILGAIRAERQPLTAVSLPEIFRLEPVGSLREQLASEALERMLSDGSMPLEEDAPTGKRARFASRQADDVVRDVLERVRLKAGIGAESFICEDYYADQSHQVGVNLVTPNAAGVVASGWYASADRIQLEFLLGANKLDTYVAATHRDKRKSGFFFMRPTADDGLPRAVAEDVERRLDELEWSLVKQDVRVVTLSDADTLAGHIAEWAQAVA